MKEEQKYKPNQNIKDVIYTGLAFIKQENYTQLC